MIAVDILVNDDQSIVAKTTIEVSANSRKFKARILPIGKNVLFRARRRKDKKHIVVSDDLLLDILQDVDTD